MPMSQAIVTLAIHLSDAQSAERARDQIAGVVGDQQKRRFPAVVVYRDRCRLVRR
jgi:hypothetical protein